MSLQSSAQKQLREHVARIERLQEEQKALGADIKDIFTVAKSQGFNPKIIRKVLGKRKQSAAERAEEDALITDYLHALEGTPMGDYIENQEKAA